MWENLLVSDIPLVDKAIRTVAVYLVVVVLLRLIGRRDLAQLNPFDLVVMLLLSNVLQNAVIGPDNSVGGAVFGAVVLLGVNALVVRAVVLWPRLGVMLEGRPAELAADGAYNLKAVRRLGLRRVDLEVAVKRQGGDRIDEVSKVTLEPGGALLVELRPEHEDASAGDIAALNDRLDRIERVLTELAATRRP